MAEKTVVLALLDSRTSVAEPLIERWGTAEDRLGAAARKRELARYNFLLGRAVLRALLYRHTGIKEWVLEADSRGKPFAASPSGAKGPAINLSHTGPMIACAVANTEALGVDIEARRPRAYPAIAQYAFGREERRRVAEEGEGAFYRIWSLREAMAKATGEGLLSAADGQDKVNDGPVTGLWHKTFGSRPWLLGHYQIENELSLSIAALLSMSSNPDNWSVAWVDASTLCTPPEA